MRGSEAERGMTLIEVMLALAIIVVLTGGVASIVQGTILASAELGELRREEQNIEEFFEVFRDHLRSLPATARLRVREVTVGDGVGQELQFRNTPGTLSFDRAGAFMGTIKLVPVRQNNGLLGLQLKRLDNRQTREFYGEAYEPGPGVLLMSDLQEIRWRFYDGSRWQDGWRGKPGLPLLVELNLRQAGMTQPIRMVFWVPVGGRRQ